MACGESAYLPKFNYDYRPVRDFILNVGRFWLEEFGIDGWRLDMPFKVPMDFWREFCLMAKSINPNAYLVGEVWRDAWPWIQGDIFDGITNYELRNLLLDYCLYQVLDAEDFAYETEVLYQKFGQAAKGMLNLLGSQDTPRVLTVFKGDLTRVKIALTYLFTTPGVPIIYYGDELGMIGENDPDCRRPMRWEDVSDVNPILTLTKKLIQLRQEHPSTRYGTRKKVLTFNGLFVYHQHFKNDELIILLNPRRQISDVLLQTDSSQMLWKDIYNGIMYENRNGFITIDNVPSVSSIILEPQVQ
jgi:glycosidase